MPPRNQTWPAPADARVEDVFPADHEPANSLRLIESRVRGGRLPFALPRRPPPRYTHGWKRIASDLGISEAEVPETALRYVLTEPTVSTVIPGKRSKRNVERNIAVTDDQGPDERRREKLHGHRWVRNFYR